MKKRFNILLLLVLLLISGLSFEANASVINGAKDDPVADQYVIPILKALQSKDMAALYNLWTDAKRTEETNASFQKLFDAWDGEEVEAVKRVGAEKHPSKEIRLQEPLIHMR